MRSHLLDETNVYRIEVLPDQDGTLRVFEYHVHEGYRHFRQPEFPHHGCSAGEYVGGGVCCLDPYELPMVRPLPPELLRFMLDHPLEPPGELIQHSGTEDPGCDIEQ